MALSADISRSYVITIDRRHLIPVAASATIYRGSAVGRADGYARALVSGDPFEGFCRAKADNSAGAAADIDAEVMATGQVELTVSGATSGYWNGAAVYATDDNTFTVTVSGTLVGRIVRWVSGTLAKVMFEADSVHDAQVTNITVAALSANADLGATVVWAATQPVKLLSLGYVTNGSQSDWGTLDGSNTCSISASTATGAVVNANFTANSQLTNKGYTSLGSLNESCSAMAANSVLTLTITNGGTAAVPAGLLLVRYVPTNV